MDMDAFFAAVEQLDDPSLRGLPVIIGGGGQRGVVSTASYEARAFGVHSAMSAVRARQLCPHGVWVRPRFTRYSEISGQVFDILRDESPRVQPVSVDEAYVDVTPGRYSHADPVETANRVRERVSRLGLTCSVGVATSKTVAKIASDAMKPDGLTVVPPGTEARFLAARPVSDMPGIGPVTATRLRALGVRTLGDLAALDDATASLIVGSSGPNLVLRARGIDPRPVRAPAEAKSISAEKTYPEDLREPAVVRSAVRGLAERVHGRLRASGRTARTVTVKIRFSDFTTHSAQRTLDESFSEIAPIVATATELVIAGWTPGVGIRLLGVGVSGFAAAHRQPSLLDSDADREAADRAERLAVGLAAVRERFGSRAVVRGRELPKKPASEGAVAADDERSDQ